MSLYTTLQVSSVLLMDPIKEGDTTHYPVLGKMLDDLGLNKEVIGNQKSMGDFFYSVLASVEDRFAYYGRSELKVNPILDDYLKTVLHDLFDGKFERSTTLAMAICGAGNKPGEMNATEGINEITDEAFNLIKFLGDLLEDIEGPPNLSDVILMCRRLEYLDKVLELVDVFVTTKIGSMLGADEYPPVAMEDLDPLEEPNFELAGVECFKDETCGCGCQFDHPMMILDGMEDFFNGTSSPAREYFMGVADSNGIRLQLYTGNEGATFDAIKELGRKAWEQLVASLKAVKTLFDNSGTKDKVEAAEKLVENNKKAFQAMKNVPAKINDAARQGLFTLTENIDASGKLKSIANQLKAPGDAPRVLDGFMGFLAKTAESGSAIAKEFSDATKALNELKTAADTAGNGDESNKDVVAANKSKVQTKTKEAKESLKKVKFELATHNKLVEGIKKAIAGVSPKIFITDTKEPAEPKE